MANDKRKAPTEAEDESLGPHDSDISGLAVHGHGSIIESCGDKRSVDSCSDLVERVLLPIALSKDDLELLGRQNRFLVLQEVLDGDSGARSVHPRVHAIALQEVRGNEVHQENARPPP